MPSSWPLLPCICSLPSGLWYPEEPLTHAVLGWCTWTVEMVKWSCLPGKGLFWQLSADGFRSTCLGDEAIWGNFPCGCSLCLQCLGLASPNRLENPLPGPCDGHQSRLTVGPLCVLSTPRSSLHALGNLALQGCQQLHPRAYSSCVHNTALS